MLGLRISYYSIFNNLTLLPAQHISGQCSFSIPISPAGIYMLKVSNRNTRTRCGICSKSTKSHQNDANCVVLAFLLLTLNIYFPTGKNIAKPEIFYVFITLKWINNFCKSKFYSAMLIDFYKNFEKYFRFKKLIVQRWANLFDYILTIPFQNPFCIT